MDRIIGKNEKYINTAVILLAATIEGERQILFEKRSPGIPQGNEVCFPGGRIDTAVDRTPEEAAVREACEELGLPSGKVTVTGYLGTLVAPLGVAVDAFAGEIDIHSLEELTPSRDEVQSVFLVPVSWFQRNPPEEYQVRLDVHPLDLPVRELGLPERYHQPWGGRKLPVYVYRTGKEIIWGITAEITREYIREGAAWRSPGRGERPSGLP
jgi:peroxisomal coenzyme A diphosphatase NUDT7